MNESSEEIYNTAPIIVQTDTDNKDGQNKCPKCGATDISLNNSNSLLRCNFCRFEFEPQKAVGMENNIAELQGEVIGSGASNIIADTNDMLTFKCSSCGAEVVVDTAQSAQARCHWCRNTLSVNQQIPNGSIPDMVLPFSITKEDAKNEIEIFVNKRKFFANPKFKEEFTADNVMGVYLPYMVVDLNGHSSLAGQGETLIRKYSRGDDTFYDADLYSVEREFDITIDDLTVESSSDKLAHYSKDKTNNIINAIMPFDIESSVKWDANYIKGYTSEKRDTNIDDLRAIVATQAKDIARYKANDELTQYDRGVRWDKEEFGIKGQDWKAAYLPVWLYSYQEIISVSKRVLHYVAVNARTKETMGSVPIHMPKLLLFSGIAEVIGIFLMVLMADFEYKGIFLLTGIVFFLIFYNKYRNKSARHKHEKETKTTITNLRKHDQLIQRQTALRNAKIQDANNLSVSNESSGTKLLSSLSSSNIKIPSIFLKKK